LTSRSPKRDALAQQSELVGLAETARQANALLGVNSVVLHQLPDNRMDSMDLLDVVKQVESEVARVQPDVIYTHHAGDLNIDHRIVNESVLTACRPQPGHSVKTILFFEVASSTEWRTNGHSLSFAPNWYVDISKTLDLKLKALARYQSEMRPWPHARSVEALEYLARWRGANIGSTAAEAFVLGRTIA
jgi:LmbE family N-acetylglucosaminyl deacetylase